MPLVMKDALKWPDLSKGAGHLRARPLRVVPRFLRKRRVRYSPRRPKPGCVYFSLARVSIPASLDRKIRQLSMLDDRSIAELVVLGLTWVVTYYAAARYPVTQLESTKPYRVWQKSFPKRSQARRTRRRDPLTVVRMVEEGGHHAWRVLAR
jgi:hypothetical protein